MAGVKQNLYDFPSPKLTIGREDVVHNLTSFWRDAAGARIPRGPWGARPVFMWFEMINHRLDENIRSAELQLLTVIDERLFVRSSDPGELEAARAPAPGQLSEQAGKVDKRPTPPRMQRCLGENTP